MAQSAASSKPAASSAFLGVDRSFLGKKWRLRLTDERLGTALSQRLGLPEIVGRILAARGVSLDAAPLFLNPTLRNLLPDPSRLRDMDVAAARLARAVFAGELIAVFGDYDVDGATSAALLSRFFSGVGGRVTAYIPDRRKEGYGPNVPALARLKEQGASLVVTVDCGTLAFEALDAARDFGLEVIVVDHHEAEAKLPAALAVINPNRLDESGEFGELAAVGVAFLLVVAVNRALRLQGWYEARAEPDLMAWLDLVALGTICDVVPLTGLNRAFVTQGLKVLAGRSNSGLAALCDVARVESKPSTYHAGYLLGPRINAGGRVGKSDLGCRLLTSEDPEECRRIAAILDSLNTERRQIESQVLASADAQVEGDASPVVIAAGEGWHVGVIGIVASRLKERFGRPACVIGIEGSFGKGSARSIPGIDLGAAVIAARHKGLLVNGGGHAMAAGFTIEREKIAPLRDFLAERVGGQGDAQGPSLGLDGALSPDAATLDLAGDLTRIGPFGAGNSEPRFAFPGVYLASAEIVGEHVRCSLSGAGGSLKAMAFRAAHNALGEGLLRCRGTNLHIAGRIAADEWQGRKSICLFIDDAAAMRKA